MAKFQPRAQTEGNDDGLKDLVTGEESSLEVTGLFVAIGNDPRTDLVKDQVELTDEGTIRIDHPSSRTSIPGVFAAGDVRARSVRRVASAASAGALTVSDVQTYLALEPAARWPAPR